MTQAALGLKEPIGSEITLLDFGSIFEFYVNMFNPWWYFKVVWMWIFNYDPYDWFIENKNDEEHYYAGKAYNLIREKF